MNCKDCAYYEENKGAYNRKHYGQCSNEKFIYDAYCDEKEEKRISKNNCLLYVDHDAYSASFEVGENFGCIHFKRRENQ